MGMTSASSSFALMRRMSKETRQQREAQSTERQQRRRDAETTGRSADDREKRSQQRDNRDAGTQRQQGRRDAETTGRSAVKRDEETQRRKRQQREARTTGRTERKKQKKHDARHRCRLYRLSRLSRLFRLNLRHCESRKARGNLPHSALIMRSPRSLMLARDDGQSALVSLVSLVSERGNVVRNIALPLCPLIPLCWSAVQKLLSSIFQLLTFFSIFARFMCTRVRTPHADDLD